MFCGLNLTCTLHWKLFKFRTMNSKNKLLSFIDLFFDDNPIIIVEAWQVIKTGNSSTFYPEALLKEKRIKMKLKAEYWLDKYIDQEFFQLFRLRKDSFFNLYKEVMKSYSHSIIKHHMGGTEAVEPQKSLLIFLWYLSKQETILSISDRFSVSIGTVFNVTSTFLEIFVDMRAKLIYWPKTKEECKEIVSGFKRYPNVLGSVDGSHVELKVPKQDHDSYINRYQTHSVNLMAICDHNKLFRYIFVGFPGSAHDSRVFQNSEFYCNIERYGKEYYFLSDQYHIIGDSAFSCETWLMTPYKNPSTQKQRFHNYILSADRVCIENAFGLLYGRWRKMIFIDVYSVEKAVKIITACIVLHNWCILHNDVWVEEFSCKKYPILESSDRQEGSQKRNKIADFLYNKK